MTNNETRQCRICGVVVATINPDKPFSSITFLDNAAVPMGKTYRCDKHPESIPEPKYVVPPRSR